MSKIYWINHKHIFAVFNLLLAISLSFSLSNPTQAFKNSESSENSRAPASSPESSTASNENLEDLISLKPECLSQSLKLKASHIRLNLQSCATDPKSEVINIENISTKTKALVFKSPDFLGSDLLFLKPGENTIQVDLKDGQSITLSISRAST